MEEVQEPGSRILVVDDEMGMREGCRRALAPLGHSVDTAADIATGLSLIQSEDYDLFLLDVMLPDGSGLDLLDPILKRDPDAICIIITGYATIELAIEATKRGAYDFLSKPFTSDQLIMAVNQGLERRQLKGIEAQAEQLAQAKTELEKLDEIKSQFMLTVAHELRAPVAAAQSYINLIMTGYVSEEELKPTLHRVQERLQSMLDLTSDLLELAHLKQARDQFAAASSQPAADVLQEVHELLREQAEQKKQTLEVKILNHPTIRASREHLKQIWTNLISNAIKYTPEGGHIVVSLRTDDGKLVGTIEDSGIGIAQEDLPNLFHDFFRTDQAKATGELGTGLGLSIVKHIVEGYKGEISVISELGQGTRFTFMLPLDPPHAESTEPA
jgi:two-component system sensor histidine kinase/response regulator